MRSTKTRILVAFEDDYRAYAGALSRAIRASGQNLDVATTGLEALQTQVARFHPHLVISSVPNPAAKQQQEGKLPLAWVELSLDPQRPSKFCVSGRRWVLLNPSLEELLDVVEETKLLVVGTSS